MRTPKNRFLLPMFMAVLGLLRADRVAAQTFTNLHNFISGEGVSPRAGLLLSGNTFYGTTVGGGNASRGTVFSINTNGTGFTNLYSFTVTSGTLFTNADGANPAAALVVSGNTLYGTAPNGGASGNGTVFAINTDGTGFTTLHSFPVTSDFPALTNSDGAVPQDGLVLSGNTLYGTATIGGSSGKGTVFALNINGTGFTSLHSFAGYVDGERPSAELILSGNTLYGTTQKGGSGFNGTVFALTTNGAGFTTLHNLTFSEGSGPTAGLILSGNTLYGTARDGGSLGYGTVFAVTTNGTGFTILHNFGYSDGIYPEAGLILAGATLYGTATSGGSMGRGTVFALNANGSGFLPLYNFTAISGAPFYSNNDGATPTAGLIASGSTLYGTALNGGTSGYGTVFSLLLPPPPPQLNIASVGNQSVLYWPASATNYILQSTTNLDSPTWVAATDAVPVIAVTVSNTAPARFFRLLQP